MIRICKRSLVIVLCIALCMSIFTTGVSAQFGSLSADGKTITGEAQSSTMVTTSWGEIPANWHGTVSKYSYDETEKIVTIDTGLYKPPLHKAMTYFMTFDSSKLKLLTKDKATNSRPSVSNTYAISKLTEEFMTAAGSSDPTYYPGEGYTILDSDGALIETESTATSVSQSEGKLRYGWSMKVVDTITGGEFPIANDYPNFLTEDKQDLDFRSYNDVVPLFTVYLKVNDGAEITAETFGWGVEASVPEDSGGSVLSDSHGVDNCKGVYKIGFPAPAAPMAKVTLIGYASRSDAENKTNPAPGLDVVLKKGTETIGTYKTGNEGVLTTDGTNATGPLSLEAGAYTCDVSGGSGSPNTVTFTVTEEEAANSTAKTVEVYTLGSSEASEQPFNIGITDEDMLGKALADNTPVKVTFGGKTIDAQVSNGMISVMTLASSNPQDVKIEAEGYQEKTVSVTFSNARAATVADVSLEQVRTTIDLTVPVKDGETALIVITPKEGGTVTDSMALELPMTLTVTGDNTGDTQTVSVTLPDGDYTYTIKSPGKEDVTMDMDVANTGLQNPDGDTTTKNKVTISDPDDSSKKTELPVSGNAATADQPTTVTGDSSATGDDITLPAITDPLYSTVGTWTASGMTVEIYLQNITASAGTYGMSFDPNVFDTGDVQVTWGTDIENPTSNDNQLTLGGTGGTQTLTNPVNANGNLLFFWRGKGNTPLEPVNAANGRVLLATVQLKYKSGLTQETVKPLVKPDTLNSLKFADSAWATDINNYYGADTTSAAAFSAKYWRPVDGSNVAGVPNRLEAAKAIHNGFYETYSSVDAGSEGLAAPQDTRQQFVFEVFSNAKTLQFNVTDTGSTAVPDATVQVFKKGDTSAPIGTGTTGPDGTVSITIPANTDVDYKVTAPGYLDKTGSVLQADQDQEIQVQLTPSLGHDVVIHSTQDTKIQLVGGQAYNGQDYFFTLNAKPGYAWPGGNLPAADKLTIKLVTGDGDGDFDTSATSYTATWDSTKNQYKIEGTSIAAPAGKLVIKVKDSADEPVVDTTQYTVTTNSGAHGMVGYTDATSMDTTGATASTVDSSKWVGTLVDTLAAGGTVSAKYSFAGDGPIDAANATKKTNGEQYQAWVIESLVVNGTSVPLSDYDKIHGVKDYQLTGIAQNQVINVTYGEATVEGNVVITPPVPDPTDKANITVIISDFGTAAVNGETPAVDGPNTKSYTVNAGDPISAVFTGDTGTPNYVIDTVTLDGVSVLTDTTKWTNGTPAAIETGAYTSGTLAFTAVGGTNYTVVVTFRAEDGPSLFAQLEVVNRSGNGGTVPTGTSIQPIGLPATVTVKADDGYELSGLDLTEPGSTIQNVMPTGTIANPYTYSTPNLKAGTTTVGASFKKTGDYFTVKLTVKYQATGANMTAATLTFTDSKGDQIVYGPDKTGDYYLGRPTSDTVEYSVSLPAETYTVSITKRGYLNYTITGFKITDGTNAGDSGDATVKSQVTDGVINFSVKDGEGVTKPIALTLGDATWDGRLVALDDIAQVANGLQASASAGQKKRADLDESGSVLASDMSYVINSYARRSTNVTYKDYIK